MPGTRAVLGFVFLLVIWVGFVPAAGVQQGGGTGPSGEAAEPVQLDDIQEVAPVEPAAGTTGAALFGRLHPAFVHFPIAWVFLLLVLETSALLTRREDLHRAGLPLLVLACLSFAPAAVTGFFRASAIGDDAEFRALMVPHRNLNIAAAAACVAALVLRARMGRSSGWAKARWPYLLLVAGAAALLMVAGHLGGKLAFGAGYLPF